MKISISNGIEYFETLEVASVKELAQQALKTNISTSVFRDGKRNIDNFLFADCIGLDIDNDNKKGTPVLLLDEADSAFAGWKHVILTTRSHQKEKHGNITDRFRVILFLERPITDPEEFYATWFWLKKQFPWIDDQCKDPSRFWYRHGGIHSGKDGKLVVPVQPEAKPMTKPAVTTQQGVRGELSKETLKLLEFGIEPGGRNGAVYKAARDFKQNCYELIEAETRILSALERNDVIDRDFPASEVKAAVTSAYSKDAKHEPRIEETKPRAFNYMTLGEVLSQPDRIDDWLIEGLLIKGGLSVIVGIPKIGKTTLVRQLEKCVLRGEKFLKRNVVKGSVIHYSFDEKARTAKRHYQTLGLTGADPMVLHFGVAGNDNYLKELEEDLVRLKPSLAVVDTLFDMVDAQDVNNYGLVKREMSGFSALAERTNCHIMFIHHQNKPNKDYGAGSGHTVLGSTAIFGSVDCCLIFEQAKDSPAARVLGVKGRSVDDFPNTTLKFDKKTQSYTVETIEDMF